jgi:hypothetical protein
VTETGECKRNDNDFAHVACWHYGQDAPEIEKLEFNVFKPIQRHYE